ncbi:hypothetical protein ACFE04_022948 [Oxalis oulophora]
MEFSLVSSSLNGTNLFNSPLILFKKSPFRVVSSCRVSTKFSESIRNNNFYEVLSLNNEKNSTFEDIKKAYRTMSLKHHPDVFKDPCMKEEATIKFVQLHLAYETLSDPILREAYDCELGLRECNGTRGEFVGREVWEVQIMELKRRSNSRMRRKTGSWASRIRVQNMHE